MDFHINVLSLEYTFLSFAYLCMVNQHKTNISYFAIQPFLLLIQGYLWGENALVNKIFGMLKQTFSKYTFF